MFTIYRLNKQSTKRYIVSEFKDVLVAKYDISFEKHETIGDIRHSKKGVVHVAIIKNKCF